MRSRSRDGSLRRGFLAAAVATALFALVHQARPEIPFPPTGLAERVVEATPGGVATFFIELLGYWAIRLLTIGTTIAYLAIASLAGSLSARYRGLAGVPFAAAVIFGINLIGYQALPGSSFSVYATVTFAVALTYGLILRQALAASEDGSLQAADAVRRRLILNLLVVGVALPAAVLSVLRALPVAGGKRGRRLVSTGEVTPIEAPAEDPAEATTFQGPSDLTPEITRNDRFYIVDESIIDPSVDPDVWRLRVRGLVDRPLDLSYADLIAMPAVEQFSTLECISNRIGGALISTAKWRGVRLAEILASSGARADAVDVVTRGEGGYWTSIPIDKALEPTTLVAYGMNGETLPRAHGYPARIIAPGLYGMKNVKWLRSIELVARNATGYWEDRGWSDEAVVRTWSRIDTDPSRALRPDGSVELEGIAFAGDRGIRAVQVSLDGGHTWPEARLRRPLSGLTWVQWLYRGRVSTKKVEAAVRAIDGAGAVQDPSERAPHPSGASGYHRILLTR